MAAKLAVGAYCRQVEACLTRANGGHLVRIVGPGFELVRGWAEEGIPLSVVFRAVEQKAERHAAGRSKRPLRIEFCETDVREGYEAWRRAIGVPFDAAADAAGDETPAGSVGPHETRRRSLGQHIDRVVDRLTRAAGRLDLPGGLRDTLADLLTRVVAMRDGSRRARGEARAGITAELAACDRELREAVRREAPAAIVDAARADAADELAPYRGRLSGRAWDEAIEVTVDRLLRERLSLPAIDVPA